MLGKRTAYLYISLSLLKRSFFILSVFLLRSHLGVSVWLQLLLNNLLSLIYIAFLITARPHESSFSSRVEIFGEMCFITIIYSGLNVANGAYTDQEIFTTEGFQTFKRTELAGYMIAYGMLITVACQTGANLLQQMTSSYKSFRYYVMRGKFKTATASDIKDSSA